MKFAATVSTVLTLVVGSCGPKPAEKKPSAQPVALAPPPPFSMATMELGREASDDSIRSLGERLEGATATDRKDAAYALGVAGLMRSETDDASAEMLLDRLTLERDASVRAAVVWALARTGGPSAVDALAAVLESSQDSEAAEAAEAAVALGVLGRREVKLTQSARAFLVKRASSRERDLRFGVAYALARAHEPSSDPSILAALSALVGDDDAEVRATAVVGLSRRVALLERLEVALTDTDWRVQTEAVRGLLAFKSAAATRALSAFLNSSEGLHPHVVRTALVGLAELASDPAIKAALPRARTSGASLDEAQVACLLAILAMRTGGPETSADACGGTPDWWREATLLSNVAAAAHISEEARVEALLMALDSLDARVRAAAATGLASLARTRLRRRVLERLAFALKDESAAVAGAVADSLGSLELAPAEAQPFYEAITARAVHELESDGELGLTLVAAIEQNHIAEGERACELAAAHRNRTIRAAGGKCLAAVGLPPVEAPPLLRDPLAAAVGPLYWHIKTSRGPLVIELEPALAPRHVEAVAKLSNDGFYDGLIFHRVVPNFVIQGGDPDGTGWGGPSFVIPAEPSPLPFARGVVGIADAGPDTGGSQWFVMHSRAPHLEGRYTRIGRVTVGLDVIDAIAVGDIIESARVSSSGAASDADDRKVDRGKTGD